MPPLTSSTLGRYTSKWLIGTGIFELARAAVFAVLGLAVPLLGFGFLLTAAILGVTGDGLIWFGNVPGQPDRQLQPSAATAPLTVTDRIVIGQTIPVKVAPDNPNLVAFDWNSLATDGPSTLI